MMDRLQLLGALVVLAAGCGGVADEATLALVPTPQLRHEPAVVKLPATPEPTAADIAAPAAVQSRCREQAPQPFLMRHNYITVPGGAEAELARRRRAHRRAIEYRTREYGYVEGFGDPRWNALEPKHYVKSGSFFGIGISMNVRVLTALGCVEETIRRECSESYTPEILDGLRTRQTFYNGEVSNHRYGIAIDIDPNHNPCCGCLPPLSDWPRCKEPVATPYERTRIPRCWVEQFERYGFYWLGHDELEDTMHFEFLGDPDAIMRPAD
jgi:hypothetical protein